MSSLWRLIAIATLIPLATLPDEALAQSPHESITNPKNRVFSFVLRFAGDDPLDPFGITGRREVLQLLAGESPDRGLFRRARLDGIEDDDWDEVGWYEIRGGVIRLYYRAPDGSASGRVEIGRYLQETICLRDIDERVNLTFSYLEPRSLTERSDNAESSADQPPNQPQPCSPPPTQPTPPSPVHR